MFYGYYLSLSLYFFAANGGLVHLPPTRKTNTVSPRCIIGPSIDCAMSNDPNEISMHQEEKRIGNNFSTIKLGLWGRRREFISAAVQQLSLLVPPIMHPSMSQAIIDAPTTFPRGVIFEIEDPSTYSAVVYVPPPAKHNGQAKNKEAQCKSEPYPLLVVLHGAGNNKQSAMHEFTNSGSSTSPPGDYTNLPPCLLSHDQAPHSLSDNFVVVAPYVGKGTSGSLYDEPRGKILSFVKWFDNWIESQCFEYSGEDVGTSSCCTIGINRQRVSLFGFSEGSTLAVELATTRQFNGVVLASYGYTGKLPPLALERLYGIPIWVFHSKGDDVYDIRYSNQLVDSLVSYHGGNDIFDMRSTVKYTKLIPEKNGVGETGLEHARSAVVASKSSEVYDWLLSL
jgi:predicted esterase